MLRRDRTERPQSPPLGTGSAHTGRPGPHPQQGARSGAAVRGRALACRGVAASMPAEYLEAFFGFLVDGPVDETAVQPTVHEVLGRAPRSFREWVGEYEDRFR